MKMHDGEVNLDAGLVGRLVAAQFPELLLNIMYIIGADLFTGPAGAALIVPCQRRRGIVSAIEAFDGGRCH